MNRLDHFCHIFYNFELIILHFELNFWLQFKYVLSNVIKSFRTLKTPSAAQAESANS